MNIPLVSEYKISFIIYRLIQTFFGGFGYTGNQQEHSSCLIILCQISLYVYPFLIGLIFSLIIEVKCLTELIGAVLAGIVSLFIIIFIHILAKRRTLRKITPADKNQKFTAPDTRLLTKIMPFAAQKSKLVIALHSVISSSLICLAVYTLQLTVIYKNCNNDWFTAVLLFLLSWFTVIISHHSITISPPPETATYATTMNTHDLISSLNRPFDVLIVLSLELINRIGMNDVKILCPILLSVYPFLWLLGIIPPLPALIQWFIERINVIIFGGGPACSTIYLLVSVLVSVCVLITCWAIDEPLVLMYISSVFGFLMSNDVLTFIKEIKTIKIRMGPAIIFISILFSIFFVNIVTTKQTLSLYFINRCLIYGISVVLLIITSIRYSQSVYIFFGLIRNPIYPKSMSGIDVFVKFKKKWKYTILAMKICLHFSKS